MAQHGTEALPPRWTPAVSEGRRAEGDTEIQWPQERVPILSDEPQVRSLPVASSPRRRGWPIAVAASAVAIAALIAIRTAPLRSSSLAHTTSDSRAAQVYQGATPASPALTFAIPAPTLAPPAFEEPAVAPRNGAAPMPSAQSAAAPSSSAKAAASASMTHPPVRRGGPGNSATERPGPGF